MRNKAFLILNRPLWAFDGGYLWAMGLLFQVEIRKRKRFGWQPNRLVGENKIYQTESGKSAASVQALTLSKSEVEKHCADLTNTVKELDLKVKRLQAASTNATKTEVEVQTIVKDSIIYRDTSYLKVKQYDGKTRG